MSYTDERRLLSFRSRMLTLCHPCGVDFKEAITKSHKTDDGY